MRHTKPVERVVGRESLKRHVLGLGVLLFAITTAYAASRLGVDDIFASVQMLESPEEAVELVAEEPAPKKVDINTHIEEVATQHGVAPKLVAAIVAVESQFNPRAVSRKGAEGLMQLMPATQAYLDVEDPFDPRDNIDGGVRHLKRLMKRFHNDLPLVLAAYNAGEQAVINHRGIPPYRETRQYVVRVLRRYDRDQAQAVAKQLAAPKRKPTPAPPRVARAMYVAPAAPRVTTTAPAASPLVPEFADLVAPPPPPQRKQPELPES
jgi:soluble lytic murein transglycosylase-like protein